MFLVSISRASEMRAKYGLTLRRIAAAPSVRVVSQDSSGGGSVAVSAASAVSIAKQLQDEASHQSGSTSRARPACHIRWRRCSRPCRRLRSCAYDRRGHNSSRPARSVSSSASASPSSSAWARSFPLAPRSRRISARARAAMPRQRGAHLYAASPGGLPASFSGVFSAAAALSCLYLLKPLLYACMDIDFMMATSLASIVCCFIPAILISITRSMAQREHVCAPHTPHPRLRRARPQLPLHIARRAGAVDRARDDAQQGQQLPARLSRPVDAAHGGDATRRCRQRDLRAITVIGQYCTVFYALSFVHRCYCPCTVVPLPSLPHSFPWRFIPSINTSGVHSSVCVAACDLLG